MEGGEKTDVDAGESEFVHCWVLDFDVKFVQKRGLFMKERVSSRSYVAQLIRKRLRHLSVAWHCRIWIHLPIRIYEYTNMHGEQIH